ncbi:MAG: GAF domain-containing protein [Anaerolineales bacterium]|nr:GAF domain-containing protein [Anaerolineales bacterium]
MHKLLERQLIQHFGSLEHIPENWKTFLADVNNVYQESEQTRATLQNSLEEMEKTRSINARPADLPIPGYRYAENSLEPILDPSIEAQQAWMRGRTMIRRRNVEEKARETRVALPIKLREQTLGVLNLSFDDDEAAQQTIPLLEQLSARLGLAMENARLYTETQTSLARTNALFQVSRSAIAFESIPDLLQVLVHRVADTLPADRVSLIIFDETKKQILHFYAGGPGAGQINTQIEYQELQNGLTGWVIREQKVALSPKNVPDPRESADVQQRRVETHCGGILVVPLLYRNQVIGTMTAINTIEQPDFTQQDADLMVAMASQAATAFENARLFQSQQQRAAELQAAAEVSRAASSILDLDELLAQTVEVIRERFGLYYVGIFLVDPTGDWAVLRAGTGEAGRIQIERNHKLRVGGESMIGQCIAVSAPRIAQDVVDESQRFKNPVLPETRSEMALPLMSRGQTIGAMTIQSTFAVAFSQENITTLQTMADQMANAILNAQLFSQAQARARELATLNEMARVLSETLDLDSIIEKVHEFTSRLIDTKNYYLALYYPEQDEIEFKYYLIDGKRVTVRDQRRRAGKGLTEHVIRTRRPLFIEQHVDDFIHNLTGVEAIGRSSECWLGVPMLAGNQVIGMINVQNYETPFYFTSQDQQLLYAVASQAAVAIQNARLFEQTQRQNNELFILNEMGAALNSILDRETILERVYEFTSRLMEFSSFAIGLYHPEPDEISLPLIIENRQRLAPQRFRRQIGLLDYVIRTKASLLLTDQVEKRAKDLGIELQIIRTTGEAIESFVAAPIQMGNAVIGVLTVQSTTVRVLYLERHRELLTSIANLAANALENARLFEQTQLQNQELAILNEMGRILNTTLEKERIFEQVFEHTSRLLDFTSFVVALYDHESDTLSFSLVIEKGERLTVAPAQGTKSLLGYVVETKTPLLVADNLEEFAAGLGIRMRTVGETAKSWLAVPILLGDVAVGVISAQTVTTPRLYTPRHRDLMVSIANQTAIAYQNATSFEQVQRQNQELATLNEMSQVLTTLLDVQHILEQIHKYTTQLIQTVDFFVALFDETTHVVSFPFVIDEGQRINIPARPLKNSVTDYVLRTGNPLLLKNASEDEIKELGLDINTVGNPAQSWLGVPLSLGQKVVGVIGVQSTVQTNAYSQRDLGLLTTIASQAAIALQNANSFAQTVRRSDDLTTLNEMGRVLSNTLKETEIVEKVYDFSSKLFDTTTFFIALYHAEKEEVYFPLSVSDGERLEALTRPLENSLTDFVIRTRQPLLITHDVPRRIEELNLTGQYFGDDRPAQCWLGVPMLIGESIIGAISVQSLHQPYLYNEYHRDLLITIASQTAITLQNAHLFQQTQASLAESTEQARRLSVLNEMSAQLTKVANVEEIYPRATQFISEIYQANRVSFSMLVNEEQVVLRAVHGEQTNLQVGQYVPLAGTANERAIKENRIVIVTDSHQTSERAIQSYMVAPILVEGRVIGTLNVGSFQPNTYHNRDENFLQQVVSLLSTLIANRQLFEQVQQALAETGTLYQASAELNAAQSYAEIVETFRHYTLLGKSEISIINLAYYDAPWTPRHTPEWFNILERWSLEPNANLPHRYPLKQFGWLIKNFKQTSPLYLTDVDQTDVDEFTRAFAQQAGFKSAIFVPLVVGGQWRGHLSGFYNAPTSFSEDDIRLLNVLAAQAAVAVQGLQNLDLARARAQEAQQRSEELALVNRVVARVAEAFDLLEGLNIVAQELGDATHAGHVGIALLNEEQTELKVVSEYPLTTENPSALGVVIPVKGNLSTERVLETKKSLYVEAAQTDPILAPMHEAFRERGILSLVILPLLARGKVAGTIGLDILEKGQEFTQDQLRLAETIVLQASNAIYNAQLYEQTQQALSETATLYQASGELNGVQTYADILSILQKYSVLGHEHARNISLNLFDRPWTADQPPESIIPLARWSREPNTTPSHARYPLTDWPNIHQLLQPDHAVFIQDTETDPRLQNDLAHTVTQQIMHAKSLLYAPLVVARAWIGHIIASYDQTISITPEDQRRLNNLTQQATIALENIRLLAESRQRAAQLLTAAEIARSASETLSQDQLLFRAVNLIRDRFHYYHASVFLLDDARQYATVRESTGEAGAEMKRRGHRLEVGSQSIVGTVTFTGNPLVVNDVTKDGVHRPNPLLPDTQAELGIPLKIGRRVIGVLDVQSTEVNAFHPDDVAVLQILADQIAIAVDNSRSYAIAQEAVREANNRVEEISTLFEISQALTSAPLSTEQIAEITASRIIKVVGESASCGISLYEEETGMMRMIVDIAYQDGKNFLTEDPQKWDFKLSDYPASQKIFETLQPIIIHADNPDADQYERKYLSKTGIKTLLILPLAVKGRAFGLIEVETWETKLKYSPEQINLVLTVANQGAAALENARLYEDQIKTAEQLREVDKLKNQFLANMSHELRTPLNSIIGFSRVILKGIDGPISELQEQDLTAIYNAGTHLLGLINDILDISRIEAGKMELSFEKIDMGNLITSVLSTAKGLVKEKPIRLESYIEPHLPLTKADPTRIRQVILNLLQNAAKFTDAGTIMVKATRQINAQGHPEVLVSVTDSGVGISPEDQKKLFQPFSQVDASPTRKAGGTGLGLSITRNLIELHGGQIDVISDVDKGSTFFFTLPALAPTGALSPNKLLSPEGVQPGVKLVLAIEDDPQIINLYQRYLEPEGYQVIPLTDSTKAVQQARQIHPFAITLDVHMPNLDGWQVIKSLKSDPATRAIPVIFCTIVENQARGYSLGATDYLMKPILGEDLIHALSRLQNDAEVQQVLVIDDDPDDLRLVEKALQLSGSFQVRLAQGGQKGLEAMQRNKPDIVILDLSMPEVDGFKVLETMHNSPKLKDIPIIILTALDLTADQQKLLAEYTQDQLRKGFLDEEGLLAILQHALKTAQAHASSAPLMTS